MSGNRDKVLNFKEGPLLSHLESINLLKPQIKQMNCKNWLLNIPYINIYTFDSGFAVCYIYIFTYIAQLFMRHVYSHHKWKDNGKKEISLCFFGPLSLLILKLEKHQQCMRRTMLILPCTYILHSIKLAIYFMKSWYWKNKDLGQFLKMRAIEILLFQHYSIDATNHKIVFIFIFDDWAWML